MSIAQDSEMQVLVFVYEIVGMRNSYLLQPTRLHNNAYIFSHSLLISYGRLESELNWKLGWIRSHWIEEIVEDQVMFGFVFGFIWEYWKF